MSFLLRIAGGSAVWLLLVAVLAGRGVPAAEPSFGAGQPVPGFALPGLGEGENGLSDAAFGGRAAVVNFFASWCLPCRQEHPVLIKLRQAALAPVYGIDFRDEPADAIRWLAELGNPFDRIGVDHDGAVGMRWGLIGLPNTYIVDAEGRLHSRHVGPLTEEALEQKILPILRSLGAKTKAR